MNNKPSILFDHQVFNMQRVGGISRYFSNLIEKIQNSDSLKLAQETYLSDNKHLTHSQLNKLSALYATKKFRGKGRLLKYLNQRQDRSIKRSIKKGEYDIFHPTYYNDDFLCYIPKRKPFVLTVHDMIHELYYDPLFNIIHNESRQKNNLIPKAAHIIAISEYTKKDILKLYPQIDSTKISVIYHGYTKRSQAPRPSAKYSRYILYVGNRQFYKNFTWMLEAIAEFLKEHDFELVCAGGGNFTPNEMELLEAKRLKSRVKLYAVIEDAQLNDLYSNAFCFIFPSLYEGFGLPILEAFANNCPVILPNSSCFPEIARDAALFYDVGSSISILNKLTSLLSDEDLRKNMLLEGNRRLDNFGWNKMFDQHREVYMSVLKN